jgi:hypothetical protein
MKEGKASMISMKEGKASMITVLVTMVAVAVEAAPFA